MRVVVRSTGRVLLVFFVQLMLLSEKKCYRYLVFTYVAYCICLPAVFTYFEACHLVMLQQRDGSTLYSHRG